MMSGRIEGGSREQAKAQWLSYLKAVVAEERRIEALRTGRRTVGLRLAGGSARPS